MTWEGNYVRDFEEAASNPTGIVIGQTSECVACGAPLRAFTRDCPCVLAPKAYTHEITMQSVPSLASLYPSLDPRWRPRRRRPRVSLTTGARLRRIRGQRADDRAERSRRDLRDGRRALRLVELTLSMDITARLERMVLYGEQPMTETRDGALVDAGPFRVTPEAS